jgi:hypothetical protein
MPLLTDAYNQPPSGGRVLERFSKTARNIADIQDAEILREMGHTRRADEILSAFAKGRIHNTTIAEYLADSVASLTDCLIAIEILEYFEQHDDIVDSYVKRLHGRFWLSVTGTVSVPWSQS